MLCHMMWQRVATGITSRKMSLHCNSVAVMIKASKTRSFRIWEMTFTQMRGDWREISAHVCKMASVIPAAGPSLCQAKRHFHFKWHHSKGIQGLFQTHSLTHLQASDCPTSTQTQHHSFPVISNTRLSVPLVPVWRLFTVFKDTEILSRY